jgi:membrane protease YdiL (CAAX protease family)
MSRRSKETFSGAGTLIWKGPILFLISFFIIWTARAFICRYVDQGIESEVLATISSFLWKTIVWIVLPILYIALVDKKGPLEYLKLRANTRKAVIWSLFVIAVGIVWQLTLLGLKLDSKMPDPREIYIAIWSAGVCEEILFRGFLLNKFSEFMSFTKATLVTSLLFVFVHLPSWLIVRDWSFNEIISGGLYVFLISLIFSVLVKKSDSLYPGMIFHCIADLIAL